MSSVDVAAQAQPQAPVRPRDSAADRDERRDQDRHREREHNDRSDEPGLAWHSLNGQANNLHRREQGAADSAYARIAPAAYADGLSEPTTGPSPRYISNRIFADNAQNLFSENGVTQWAYNWGQFIDHTIALREAGEDALSVAFDPSDPLERFTNEQGELLVTRSSAMSGSGIDSPREQRNTISSYIDAWAVYGGDEQRLEWLREGPVDGDLSNNGARLLLTDDGYLPTADSRGDAASAPMMERLGHLLHSANADADAEAVVAGDIRANENIALTAVQTLFAREHNRIVDQLPTTWSEQRRFDVARALVIATQQYITYEEFLPALGIRLSPATGYRADVDASVSNEFATVGYRAHSMIHGEIEMQLPAERQSAALLESLVATGIEVEQLGDHVEVAVPLNIAFHRPQLVPQLGLEAILAGLGAEAQYRNDEQIDDQLRSVMFQLPVHAVPDAADCLDGPTLNDCFVLVNDLGVLDIVRARDHGIASYNDLRRAYGLDQVFSFAELTGEANEDFPLDDPLIETGDAINDPDILAFTQLYDGDGVALEIGSEDADGEAIVGVRRTTLAARLKAIYQDVDQVDAFVGMVSEPHLPGSEFGELQSAMWQRQFEALRDGDRFHYAWHRALERLMRLPELQGLTYRQRLHDVIVNNTDLLPGEIQENLFLLPDA